MTEQSHRVRISRAETDRRAFAVALVLAMTGGTREQLDARWRALAPKRYGGERDPSEHVE